jgi:hypothetical protein
MSSVPIVRLVDPPAKANLTPLPSHRYLVRAHPESVVPNAYELTIAHWTRRIKTAPMAKRRATAGIARTMRPALERRE